LILGRRSQRLAEGAVEIVAAGPVRTSPLDAAKLDEVGAEAVPQGDGVVVERGPRRLVRRQRAGVDAERRGHKPVAEQAALHVHQREHAADLSRPFHIGIVCRQAERLLDHPPPGGAVEERGRGMALDEAVPARNRGVVERPYLEAVPTLAQTEAGAATAKTRSIRSQEKSFSSIR